MGFVADVWLTCHVLTHLPLVSYICAGLILGLWPANERQCHFAKTSLIGWVQT